MATSNRRRSLAVAAHRAANWVCPVKLLRIDRTVPVYSDVDVRRGWWRGPSLASSHSLEALQLVEGLRQGSEESGLMPFEVRQGVSAIFRVARSTELRSWPVADLLARKLLEPGSRLCVQFSKRQRHLQTRLDCNYISATSPASAAASLADRNIAVLHSSPKSRG